MKLRDSWRFPLMLLLFLAALLPIQRVQPQGDLVEYSLVTIAMAKRGTPDVRLEDIADGRRVVPGLAPAYDILEKGMRAGDQQLYAAFARGREGKVYAVHFFGYPALAAIPYKAFDAAGINPLKAFHLLNMVGVFILGLAMRRLFGTDRRAFAGVGLFLLCGGILYLPWTSPELLSASALLAGLIFYLTGAPVAGSVLAGFAGMQNPTIVFFFAFAPLLHLVIGYDKAAGLRANLLRVLGKRYLLGLAAGMAVFAVPPLFNLWQFGVPNIIAKLFSDATLIGPTRLHSFFFDLNQGMMIGLPAVLLMLAFWGWRSNPRGVGRELAIGLVCAAFTLALAIPALAVLNWNSGAAGIMRYAFWSAMPLLLVLLLRLRNSVRWPSALLAAVMVAQLGAMLHARSYGYVEFSPLALQVMKHAPGVYHPEPEIFAERTAHNDDYIYPMNVYTRDADGHLTTLYNTAHPGIEEKLCGTGARVDPASEATDLDRNWRYLEGPVRCVVGGVPQQTFLLEQFKAGKASQLVSGWSAPEANGPGWDGVWSDGPQSRIIVQSAIVQPKTISIVGNYLEGNTRTRVRINGVDLGWLALEQPRQIELPESARTGQPIDVLLEHEAPHRPGPGDRRSLAFFIREITLR